MSLVSDIVRLVKDPAAARSCPQQPLAAPLAALQHMWLHARTSSSSSAARFGFASEGDVVQHLGQCCGLAGVEVLHAAAKEEHRHNVTAAVLRRRFYTLDVLLSSARSSGSSSEAPQQQQPNSSAPLVFVARVAATESRDVVFSFAALAASAFAGGFHSLVVKELSGLVAAKRQQSIVALLLHTHDEIPQQKQQRDRIVATPSPSSSSSSPSSPDFMSDAFAALSDTRLADIAFALLRQAFGPTSSLAQAINVLHARQLRLSRLNERCRAVPIVATQAPLPLRRERPDDGDASAPLRIGAAVAAPLPFLRPATVAKLPFLSFQNDAEALPECGDFEPSSAAKFQAQLVPANRDDFLRFVESSSSPSVTSFNFQFDNKFLVCGTLEAIGAHPPPPQQQQQLQQAASQQPRSGGLLSTRSFRGTPLARLMRANNRNNTHSDGDGGGGGSGFFSTTVICRAFIMDQHAVSERGRLEAFLRAGLHRCCAPVRIAPPFLIPMDAEPNRAAALVAAGKASATEAAIQTVFVASLALKYRTALERWGWRIAHEEGQGSAVAAGLTVTSVPRFTLETFELLATGPEPLVEYLLHLHQRLGPAVDAHAAAAVPPPLLHRFAVTRSCRGAVMFGDDLTADLRGRIVRNVAATASFDRCSHGRVSLKQLPVPLPAKTFLQQSPYAALAC